MNSEIGQLLESIADHLADTASWDTPPSAQWFPDFDRATLEESGLTAYVLPVSGLAELDTRAGRAGGDLVAHVAVIAPIQTSDRAAMLAAGDAVALAAEQVRDALLGERVGGAFGCIEAEHNPYISREMARQHSLWVSYVISSWKRA